MIGKKLSGKQILTAAAGLLCCGRIVLGFMWQHLPLPRYFLYVDYAFVLLFAGAFFLYMAPLLYRHRSPAALLRSFDGGLINGYTIMLPVLFLLFFFSSLLTEFKTPGSFRLNLGCLLDCGISFFALFPLGYWFALRGDDRFLCRLIDLMTLVFVGFLALGFLELFTDIEQTLLPGVTIWDGRFYLATHPNVTGLECAALMIAGIYRILRGSRLTRILYGIAELLLGTGLILTDSRASILSAMAGFGILALLVIWKRFGRNRSLGKMVLIAAAAGVLCLALFWLLRHLPHIMGDSGFQARKFTGDKLGAGSGRLDLWWTIVSDIFPHQKDLALHGCGPYGIWDTLAELAGTREKFGYTINSHNLFLETALGYGIPAFLVFFAWLLLLARCALRIGTAPFQQVSIAERIIPLLLLTMLLNDMFETSLLFYRYPNGNFFFFAAGHVCGSFQHRFRSPR